MNESSSLLVPGINFFFYMTEWACETWILVTENWTVIFSVSIKLIRTLSICPLRFHVNCKFALTINNPEYWSRGELRTKHRCNPMLMQDCAFLTLPTFGFRLFQFQNETRVVEHILIVDTMYVLRLWYKAYGSIKWQQMRRRREKQRKRNC